MKRIFSILSVVALLSSGAFAQEFAKAGVIEFGGNAEFASSTGVYDGNTATESSTLIAFEPMFGYFVMDGLEIGLDPLSYMSRKYPGFDAINDLGIWLTAAYNFSTNGSVFPYLQALGGYTTQSQSGASASGISFGFAGGAKIKVTGGLLLNVGVSYRMITEKPSGATNRFGENDLAVVVGLSGFLGK